MTSGRRDFLRSTPPLSFLLPIIHPLGKTFFLSPVFRCMKNSRWRLNFLRCERSLEKISPALQARLNLYISIYYKVFEMWSFVGSRLQRCSHHLAGSENFCRLTKNTITDICKTYLSSIKIETTASLCVRFQLS